MDESVLCCANVVPTNFVGDILHRFSHRRIQFLSDHTDAALAAMSALKSYTAQVFH